jgi:hypothetical protein
MFSYRAISHEAFVHMIAHQQESEAQKGSSAGRGSKYDRGGKYK